MIEPGVRARPSPFLSAALPFAGSTGRSGSMALPAPKQRNSPTEWPLWRPRCAAAAAQPPPPLQSRRTQRY